MPCAASISRCRKGELLAIMGPSGSGKSTLLHILGGVETPTTGQVLLEGVDLATLNDDQRTIVRRERMGFIFQSFNLLPAFTAEENVALPLELGGMSSSEARKRAADCAASGEHVASPRPRAEHDVGGRAAAGGDRQGSGHSTRLAAGRRADRQSRQRQRPAGYGVAAEAGHPGGSDDRHGDARRQRGRPCRSVGAAARWSGGDRRGRGSSRVARTRRVPRDRVCFGELSNEGGRGTPA